MTVVAQVAVSLAGYVAGPNDGRGNPLGDRGETVHAWVPIHLSRFSAAKSMRTHPEIADKETR